MESRIEVILRDGRRVSIKNMSAETLQAFMEWPEQKDAVLWAQTTEQHDLEIKIGDIQEVIDEISI